MLDTSRASPNEAQDNSPSNICVATEDLLDHSGRPEVAASMAAIAQAFGSQGKQVTLLWISSSDKLSSKQSEELKNKFYDQSLINLEILTASPEIPAPLASPEKRSAALYHYLKSKNFDAVYFALEGGLAYYTLLAKETGVFAPRPQLTVVCHSPNAWLSQVDRFFFRELSQISISHMERRSAEMADRLISASADLLDWMLTQGWHLPQETRTLPPILPFEWRLPTNDDDGVKRSKIQEIVLFAGPNYRDGVTLFCETIDRLAQLDLGSEIKITVFGPFARILGEHTGGMLLRRSRRWPFELQIMPRLGFREIIEYTKTRNALALIPAIGSATGHWLAACQEFAIPYVGTAVGANLDTSQDEASRGRLTVPDPRALADLIRIAISDSDLVIPQDISTTRQELWLSDLEKAKKSEQTTKESASQQDEPLVSIVMAHYDRPQHLLQAIAAIEAQTYSNIEVILVDDGSKLPQSHATLDRLEKKFQKRNWQILRTSNKYLGAARNAGTKIARGERILFVDDDNALFKDAVRTYVHAMDESGADICTSFHRVFYGQAIPQIEQSGTLRYFPIGGPLDLGLMYNVFGDANAMIRRSVFDKIGYQLEDYGYTCQDWEFFARAVMAGLDLKVIPEPLYWYRSNREGMYRSSHWHSNRLPILAAYEANGFRGLEYIYHLALSRHAPEQEIHGFRENLIYSPSDWRYLELSKLEPNSGKALELLAATAAAEGRVNTSLSILGKLHAANFRSKMTERLNTQPAYNPFLGIGAGITKEQKFNHRDLQDLEIGSSAIEFNSPASYVEAPDRFFLEAKDDCVSFAVLPRSCPLSALSVSVTVSLDQEFAVPADFLIVIAPPHLDPLVAIQSASEAPADGYSGWCSVMYAFTPRLIEAVLSTPGDEPANLILAVRSNVGSSSTLGCFSGLTMRTAFGHHPGRRPRLGPPPTKRRARALYREEMDRAALTVAYPSELPLLLLAPKDGGLFLRPHKAGPVVAVIPAAFPAFARRLVGKVEIAHDEAGPFEFAIALAWPQATLDWQSDQPRNCLAFSGWVRVEDRFMMHDIVANLPELTKAHLSIHLAIRAPKKSSVSPANTFWRKLVVSWDD